MNWPSQDDLADAYRTSIGGRATHVVLPSGLRCEFCSGFGRIDNAEIHKS